MIIRMLWALVAALLVAVLIFESARDGWATGGTVILFALLPDIALIGAFDPHRQGQLRRNRVGFYNALHRPWIPSILVGLGLLTLLPALGGAGDGGRLAASAGLAWLAHIAVDRVSGYGLRDAEGAIRPVGGTRRPAWCQA